jgi:dynein heavy chain, axonemal
MQIVSYEDLQKVLEDKLAEYNDQVSAMDLVLFTQAMQHITRISRIIDQPKGHALLVGVGGSGKQSLSQLSRFILGYDVFRIVVTSSFNLESMRLEQQKMFMKAGVQGVQTLFILTDSQIVNERFLISINDILSSGYVPELFADDEKDDIRGKIRSEAKSNGVPDMPEDLWNFFLDKVTKNLHLCLCFSPVSEKFRIRARMFPALISSTNIDWFHEWPKDALIGVAAKFLKEVDLPSEEVRDAISRNMAFTHISVGEASVLYKKQARRYNYTTPTSFLELISFYKLLLRKKQGEIIKTIDKLENGLSIMENTNKSVDALKEKLVQESKVVAVESERVQIIIDEVTDEKAKADVEEEAASKKAAEVKIIKDAADLKEA